MCDHFHQYTLPGSGSTHLSGSFLTSEESHENADNSVYLLTIVPIPLNKKISSIRDPGTGLSTKSLRPQESCLSVRPYATLFLGNRSLLFSETLQLVRACRCEKNVPSAFLIIFTVLVILLKNCHNWRCWIKIT